MATKRGTTVKKSVKSVKKADVQNSPIIQFAVVFIFIATIALVAYVVKLYM